MEENKIIPLDVKQTCVAKYNGGMLIRDIYDSYYVNAVENPCSLKTFRNLVPRWSKKIQVDTATLDSGTYEGFIPYNATVQVSNTGEIVQAWIRQRAGEFNPEEFIEAIRSEITPYIFTENNFDKAENMLEIPLFDMHWGICYMDDYRGVLNRIVKLITSKNWDQIVIPFGQDYFHNDSVVNGVTTKGTPIEKVDMVRAVKEGRDFIINIIDTAIANSNTVSVLYTPGNHDRSISWMFMQILLERYGNKVVDDTFCYRKAFSYGKNAIMVTHGDSKRATPKHLMQIFAVTFPVEFANASNREVHAGHLHHEGEGDIFGTMVRRLSSGVTVDDWSNREDFVGTHRRFMLFEWSEEKLDSIHYV